MLICGDLNEEAEVEGFDLRVEGVHGGYGFGKRSVMRRYWNLLMP